MNQRKGISSKKKIKRRIRNRKDKKMNRNRRR